ncbi:uncharacterized protein LOC106153394 [Lingula anatina]|uniref:Uncharacterized protein LOC106153394 n=1 Tax=Lingula anatina TaxID=7574 RepID=A0A1S3H9I1_LINAN|nr:uncharacterized protein LOC106153394 [Lingula anatina]|eukprot:XP_013382755.1 uncharacterized protein LOC106153394 [Lingula anatina]
MSPTEASKENNSDVVWKNLYGDTIFEKAKFKFNTGDTVRLSKYRTPFAKGYEQGWTQELFTITQRLNRSPPVYKVEDYEGEEIEGVFYEPEMIRVVKKDDVYTVEKILKSRGKGKSREHFVKWRGYPEKFNSWIKASDVKTV